MCNNLSEENAVSLLQLADQEGATKLKSAAIRFIRARREALEVSDPSFVEVAHLIVQ